MRKGSDALARAARWSSGRGGEDGVLAFRRRVAYLIVAVSLAGSFVSYQASKASQQAGGLDGRAGDERLAKVQSASTANLGVFGDLTLLGQFEEHVKNGLHLYPESAKLRDRDPGLARELGFEFSAQEREQQTMLRFFRTAPEGSARRILYDPDAARANLILSDPANLVTKPRATRKQGASAHERAVGLTRAAALLVGSLFFLTLAQLAITQRRRPLALVGVLVATLAAAQYLAA